MRDIPVFTTENGAASLILREIPYSGKAYIRLQASREAAVFIKECGDFCRMAGAKACFATGENLEDYPVYTTVYRMQGAVLEIREGEGAIFPVTEETLPRFLEIYNEKMAGVPLAAYLTKGEGVKLLKNAYFVHSGNTLLGIGVVEGNKISAIAACQKGAGRAVLAALCRAMGEEQAVLEVADNNLPALRLYERCGFVKTGVVDRWHKIF